MSVIYMGQATAAQGKREQLGEFYRTVVLPAVRGSEGIESCQLLVDVENPDTFVVIEVWESEAAHQASVKNISPEAIAEFRTLVTGAPSGSYYQEKEQ